jgi:hypothetical protein
MISGFRELAIVNVKAWPGAGSRIVALFIIWTKKMPRYPQFPIRIIESAE